MSVTVAGIDCGTNSIRLMIARANSVQDINNGKLETVVPRIMRVVRLGEGVDVHRKFSDAALKRVYAAIDEFAQIIQEHRVDAIRFVATSATRDASNREEFEKYIEAKLHTCADVISGEEEARLSFLGATSVVDRARFTPPFLVVDLGGGSTELVLGGNTKTNCLQVQASYSMNIGSVRMSERHHLEDAPSEESIAQAAADIDEHISEAAQSVDLSEVGTIIGVSGTVTTMTALSLGQREYKQDEVDGKVVSIDDVAAVNDTVVRMPRSDRGTLSVVHPGRRDVIGGGALVWSRVLNAVRAATKEKSHEVISYVASEHGLLDGIVRDLAVRTLEQQG